MCIRDSDIVDAWAAEEPDKKALLWTNDKGEHIQYTYADLKKYTDCLLYTSGFSMASVWL